VELIVEIDPVEIDTFAVDSAPGGVA
jgi:hypothetical protein